MSQPNVEKVRQQSAACFECKKAGEMCPLHKMQLANAEERAERELGKQTAQLSTAADQVAATYRDDPAKVVLSGMELSAIAHFAMIGIHAINTCNVPESMAQRAAEILERSISELAARFGNEAGFASHTIVTQTILRGRIATLIAEAAERSHALREQAKTGVAPARHFNVAEHGILKFIIHEPGSRKPFGERGFQTQAEAEGWCELFNQAREGGRAVVD